MQYMGSKNKIAKHLLPFILERLKPDQHYVEPFVGGANMMDKVDHPFRIGADLNYHLIEMWRALQKGWQPPLNISKADHTYLKAAQDIEDPALVAFVGFLCSFGGRWFCSYSTNRKGDNYADRGSRMLKKQIPHLKDVDFRFCSYQDLEIPEKSLIYCDPPYRGTGAYKMGFDNDLFWQWCREKTTEGHTVLISEYSAPADFECLLEIEHYSAFNPDKSKTKKTSEKLFIFNDLY